MFIIIHKKSQSVSLLYTYNRYLLSSLHKTIRGKFPSYTKLGQGGKQLFVQREGLHYNISNVTDFMYARRKKS